MTTAPSDPFQHASKPATRPVSPPGTAVHGPAGGSTATTTGVAGRVGALLDQAWQEAQADNAERRRLAAWAGDLAAPAEGRARAAGADMPPGTGTTVAPGMAPRPPGPAAASPTPSAAPDTVPAWWLEWRASVAREESGPAASAAPRPRALLDTGDGPP